MYKFFKIIILVLFNFVGFYQLGICSEEKIKIGLLVPLTGIDKEIGHHRRYDISFFNNSASSKINRHC